MEQVHVTMSLSLSLEFYNSINTTELKMQFWERMQFGAYVPEIYSQYKPLEIRNKAVPFMEEIQDLKC